MNVSGFLLARIAEDEEAATSVSPELSLHDAGYRYDENQYPVDQAFVDHFSAARILAECAAKRRIVEGVLRRMEAVEGDYAGEFGITDWVPPSEELLRLLALPYADHPDFDPAWNPEATQ